MKNNSNKSSLAGLVFNKPFFFVDVEGIGEIEALIDTAGVCLIQKDLLSKSILSKTSKSSSSCYLINGSEVENNLGYINLVVTILGLTVSVPFYIAILYYRSDRRKLHTPWRKLDDQNGYCFRI